MQLAALDLRRRGAGRDHRRGSMACGQVRPVDGQAPLGQGRELPPRPSSTWPSARPARWREQVKIVAIDTCALFKPAMNHPLPHARLVVDHFHAAQLADATLTEVRRRVTIQHRSRHAPQRQPRVEGPQPADPPRRQPVRPAVRRAAVRPETAAQAQVAALHPFTAIEVFYRFL
ncbi:transposase [Hamadaea sp. NPDC051192]|uniref:transposase n=1 Tax=Hamadaea sp. NPDC051192 TaxID=3154940 RepID=UPI0034477401